MSNSQGRDQSVAVGRTGLHRRHMLALAADVRDNLEPQGILGAAPYGHDLPGAHLPLIKDVKVLADAVAHPL